MWNIKAKLALLSTFSTIAISGGSALGASARPAAGSITPERLKMPSGPSSVRGLADEPTVDAFSAQLEYQVPIELPGGYGGLAPKLALTYSGTLGNGPLGIGWTLAQPKIQRTTRYGVPRFDDTDELEISGIVSGRLVAIGSGQYRVEGMGQTVRVLKVGAGFQVDDGAGVTYVLGASAASRQESDANHTLTWLVESETNLMGEQIAFQYTHDRNEVYLTGITWGPGAQYSATLTYVSRNDRTRSFRSGFPVDTAQRLSSISISVIDASQHTQQVRRTYQLAYDDSFTVSRLKGVTSTGVAGQGAWPALSFTYATPSPAVTTPLTGIGTWRLNSGGGDGTTLVDLDGDGAAELLQLSASGHSFLSNQKGAFIGPPQPLTGNALSLSALQLQDVDGDARAELLQDSASGWVVYKFDRSRWVQVSSAWPGTVGVPLKQPTTTRFGDLNGDGLVDVIQWDNDNLRVRFATRTGLGSVTSLPKVGGAVVPTTLSRFQDTNGDGLDDFIVVATDHLDVYLGHGDGTFEAATSVAYPFVGTISSPQDIELADLDRDGLIDLLKLEQGNVLWFHGLPDGTFSTKFVRIASPETLTSSVVVAVADINGNGSQDVVWSSASGMWSLDMAGATTAGMLTEVTNGLGMDVTFAYKSSHELAVDAANDGNAWTTMVPISIPVPVQKTTAVGPGEPARQISYSVRDGFWDAFEHRFGGFLATIVTTAGATPAQTAIVITRYLSGVGADPWTLDRDRVLRGRAQTIQIFNGAGNRLETITNTWATQSVTGLADTPLARRAILNEAQVRYEDTTPMRFTDTTYTYDGLGRATHVLDSGRNDVTGDETVTDTFYADDNATWVRDRVCEKRISGTSGTVFSDVQTLFGDEQSENSLCVVGKGWPRETLAWLASENRWISQSQTRYDAHGNPISVTTNGVEHRYVYDPSGLFPIEEHVTGPSRELVWQASWDPVLGVIAQTTDLNGHVTHLYYDSLGRYTGESIDSSPAYTVIEYDWTPPFPKTTTWVFDGALADVTARPATWSADSHWRQRVEVANGKGDVRYHALRLADAQWIISNYHEVDPNDRVVFAGRPVYAPQLELPTRPTGIVGDALLYDPLGRLIEQDLPTGAKRTYTYVAFERTMQEADLAPVHSVLDGQGRAILTERSLPDGTHEIVRATYDPAGRLTQMTLSGGTVTRTFTYDTLGRLTQSHDPDLGTRALGWDDGNRLLSETNAVGQSVRYSYDGLGRLSTRDTGAVFRYHYDDARPGAGGALSNLSGQLAWVEEPTGGLDFGYDELGRVSFSRRRIDAQLSELTVSYAASGVVLGRSYDDGVALTYQYDPAGRLIQAGDLWSLQDQDASGAPLHERAKNGVDTRTTRDLLGLPSEVNIHDVTGAEVYHASATRNGWSAITAVTDLDAVGLDHNATYSYDGFARLTGATLGTGMQGFAFGYGYDVLHNMTSRTATGPRALGAFLGTYKYGEAGAAARQLTSIVGAAGQVTHRFGYDAAGRQTSQDQQTMIYDASDRLLRVDSASGGTVAHAYGHDGARIKTTAPDASTSYFFGDGTALRGGVREHDVDVGGRVVARISAPEGAATGATAFGDTLRTVVSFGARALGLALLGLALVFRGRWARRRALAAATAGLTLAASCAAPSGGSFRNHLSPRATTTYLHTGFAAGPALYTGDDGRVLEERRYEPFGVPVDARIHTASGDVLGAPDVVARDLNELNKRTDAATGWSDHGARWIAPETGRWLTTDPPVAGPDAQFMASPWALHPYQYVNQNPVTYWDPDGQSALAVDIWRAGTETARELASSGTKVGQVAGAVVLVGTAVAVVAASTFAITSSPDYAKYSRFASPEAVFFDLMEERRAASQARTVNRSATRTVEDGNSDRPAPFRMRVQIQTGRTNLSSVAISRDKPITGIEIVMAFWQAISNMPSGYRKDMDGILRANMNMTQWVRQASLSGGIQSIGNVHREAVEGASPPIRLDLENLLGHNLRTPD